MDLESFFEKNASTKIFTKLLTSKYSIFCQKKTMECTPSQKSILNSDRSFLKIYNCKYA